MDQINKEVLSKVESYFNILKLKWDSLYPRKDSYFSFNKTRIIDCTVFLLSVLDNLIIFVQENIPKGSDKKFVVMSVASRLFEYIVVDSSPLWLKPFIPLIREIVINIIISQIIEFIVKKYKEGSWNKQDQGISNPPDLQQKSIVYNSIRRLND